MNIVHDGKVMAVKQNRVVLTKKIIKNNTDFTRHRGTYADIYFFPNKTRLPKYKASLSYIVR